MKKNGDNLNGTVEFYYQQYMKSYVSLNLEFSEFIAGKLRCTEHHAVQVIRTWKNNKQLINA